MRWSLDELVLYIKRVNSFKFMTRQLGVWNEKTQGLATGSQSAQKGEDL